VKSTWNFDSDKTYVIAGGTGGLGRAIASWMVKEKGARNLLLLSRSGMAAASAEETVKELREYGGVIEVASCDICDLSALRSTLERYRDGMPRIGGCIQSSMVLRDSVFANMSYENWKACTDVKTIGSWNLHTLLPDNMDFFIMLSSIAGVIGSAGQANYAAANTYLDALAHYRTLRGQKSAALDLGVMLDHGVLADNTALRERILAQGLLAPISAREFYALLDHYCNPQRTNEKPEDMQLVIGLASPSQAYARGALRNNASLSLPFYSHVYNSKAARDASASGARSSEDQKQQAFVSAPTLIEAGAVISKALVERLITMTPGLQDRIDVNVLDEPMWKFGIDSLLAIELRSWFSKIFAADVPIFEILGDETLESLGVKAAQKSTLRKRPEVLE
jgi:NAD(P)-dependent dehydrogenase (short-subunit alcohol dehydrogenase family)